MQRNSYRVLMLCEYFFPFDRGGSEWSVYYLARSLIKENYQIEILTPNYGDKTKEQIDGITVYRFPFIKKLKNRYDPVTPFYHTNFIWFFSTLIFLIYRIIACKPTHIHVQGKYFIPAATIAAKFFRIPLIVTLRDYIALCPLGYCIHENRHYKMCTLSQVLTKDLMHYLRLQNLTGSFPVIAILSVFRGWFVSKLLRFFLRYADHINVISKKMALIYTKNDIHVSSVVYNIYTQVSPIKPAKTQNYLLFVGRFTEGKGFDVLIGAYTTLNKKNLPQLLVVGSGSLRKIIKAKISSKITTFEQKTHSEVLDLMRKARAVIVPSIWEEPFGRVALEAQAMGVPVLASNKGALPEIIVNGKTGIIVEPSVSDIQKGILLILKKEKYFRAELKKSKQSFIQKFAFKPVKQFRDIYEKSYQSKRVSGDR